MLAFPGRVTVDGLAELPVAVDVDVRRATEWLGLSATAAMPAENAVRIIEQLWTGAVAAQPPLGPPELAGTALALDAALRFHGRTGCRFCREKLVLEPITAACANCKLRG
jgi:hypothetical protein